MLRLRGASMHHFNAANCSSRLCNFSKQTTQLSLGRPVVRGYSPIVLATPSTFLNPVAGHTRATRSRKGCTTVSAVAPPLMAPTAEPNTASPRRELHNAIGEFDEAGNFEAPIQVAKNYQEVASAKRDMEEVEDYVLDLESVLQGLRQINEDNLVQAVAGSIAAAQAPITTPASSKQRAPVVSSKPAKRGQTNSGLGPKTAQLDVSWLNMDLNDAPPQRHATNATYTSPDMVPSTSQPSAAGLGRYSRRFSQPLPHRVGLADEDTDLVTTSRGKAQQHTKRERQQATSGGRRTRTRQSSKSEEDEYGYHTNNSLKRMVTGAGSVLLTAEEEIDLALQVKDYLLLDKTRKDMAIAMGKAPSLTDMARELKMDPFDCNLRLEAGRQARKILMDRNMRLVVSVAKGFVGRGMNMDEMVAEGLEGLLRGVEKFDPTKGFKLSTYAHWWIRQSINRTIGDQRNLVRLPVHIQDTQLKLIKAQKSFKDVNDRYPTDTELQALTGMKMSTVQQFRHPSKEVQSADQKAYEKSDESLVDGLEDEGVTSDDMRALTEALGSDLEEALALLEEREAFVLRKRYGIGCPPHILEEVGAMIQLSRERVRQIEAKALQKLCSPDLIESFYILQESLVDREDFSARRSMGTRKT